MIRPAIVFRADASHAIGLGHVARLCALIEQLDAHSTEPIAMFGGDLTARVAPWSPAELFAAAAEPRVRAVVVDGPQLAATVVPGLLARGIRTVLVDDRGDCALAVDAVVNHNFHAPALAAGYPAAHLRLLGRSYLMLRQAIRRYPRGACRPSAATRLRVVVTFGGSDPVGATARTLPLIPPDRPLDLAVLAGPGFRDDRALAIAAATATAAGHTVEILRATDDPGGVFVHADAAICSAGGTLGELAYLGCPALALAIVPDQVASARSQVRHGLIASGFRWPASDDRIRSALFGFLGDDRGRLDQRQRALATCDGEGAQRIIARALG